MAEVRIPTEQIPVDILQRLQDILDRKFLMGSLSRVGGLTNMSASSQLLPSSTCLTSPLMPVQPSSFNVTSNMASFAASSSSSFCKGSSDAVFSVSSLPSTTSTASPCMFATSRASPCMFAAAAASPHMFAAAAAHYTSATSATRLPVFTTTITADRGDEVDGGSCDPMTQLAGPSPRKRRLRDVLDDSGIVRVFPMEDDPKTADAEDHKSTSQKDSEIVRIFPDMDTSTSMVRALTPVHITPRPGSFHMFDNSRELPQTSRTDWNCSPLHDNTSQSAKLPVSQRSVPTACDTTPRRQSRPCPGHCDVTIKQANAGNFHNLDSNCSKNMSCAQSPHITHHANEADKHSNMRHFSSNTGNARRSPELPTPPQTPDDADGDIGDDEVFTFTAVGCEDKYLPQPCEATRKVMESTPRRACVQLRHHSDRSGEAYQQVTQVTSSFGPTMQMSELDFGDRQKTRKRLSFDEVMVSQPPNTDQHPYNDPSLPSQFPPHGSASGSNLFLAHTSRIGQAGSNKNISPVPKFHSHAMPSSFLPCRSPQSSPEPHQANVPTNQTTSTPIHQLMAPSLSPFHPTSRRSPVKDVFAILEKAVQKQTAATPRRSRLHSDSDYVTQGHSQGLVPCDRRSPQPEPANTRRQTFSFGNRKDRDVQNDDKKRKDELTNSPTQLWSREQNSCTEDDCYCSKIARNFLQMVERAYTGISQMDGTQAGFDRFRQELTQTNDVLRESLTIVHNIRAMCRHNSRSLSGFSATQAQ